MESTHLTCRDAQTHDAVLVDPRRLLESSALQRGNTLPAAEGADLVLVVGVVRKAPGADSGAVRALYCAAVPPGTPLEREQFVSAVSGLVRRFEGAPSGVTTSRLPTPKWG